jgi:hypothetical protein
MRTYQAFSVVFVLGSLAVIGSAQVYNTVKICARLCSDGSTYTKCIDTYGSASQGDCHERISCPSPLTNAGDAYDLGEDKNLKFKEISACQKNLDNMRKNPNLPVIVSKKVVPPLSAFGSEPGSISEAFGWHRHYSEYSDQEKLMLGRRIVTHNKKTRDLVYTDEEVLEVGRRSFEFVQKVIQLSSEAGVYTNSKCAGCSLIMQSIEEKLTSAMCSQASSLVTDVICQLSTPVLSPFCNFIISAVEVDTLLETLCQGVLSSVINATGLRYRANLLCSTLTCENQPSTIQKESQITGNCKAVTAGLLKRSYNERCDQILSLCNMAEKGFCIGTTIKEFKEQTGSFVEAAIDTIGNLVIGKTPSAVESVQKLATECMNIKCGGYSSATMSAPITLLLLIALAILL